MPLRSRTALCAPSHPATQATSVSWMVPSGSLSRAETRSGACARPTSSVFHSTDWPWSRSRSPMIRSLSSWPRMRMNGYGVALRPASPRRTRALLRPPAHTCAPRAPIGAGARPAERGRGVDDAEVRVDLERAGLHTERSRLARRADMAVDDPHPDATPRELVGEHQAGRTGADDQDVGIHADLR